MMSKSLKKAKLAWSCRRGMLELDLMLRQFIENYFDALTSEQMDSFELLLEHSDPELFAWLMGSTTPPNKELASIVDVIRLYNPL